MRRGSARRDDPTGRGEAARTARTPPGEEVVSGEEASRTVTTAYVGAMPSVMAFAGTTPRRSTIGNSIHGPANAIAKGVVPRYHAPANTIADGIAWRCRAREQHHR